MQKNVNIPASYLILKSDDEILLMERKNTGFHDGDYSLIAGHVEPGENFTDCIIRETEEEAGIVISPEDITVCHIMQRKSHTESPDRIDVFFLANRWTGDPCNNEPSKCEQIAWFPIDSLPENTIPYVTFAVKQSLSGILYSEYGWGKSS